MKKILILITIFILGCANAKYDYFTGTYVEVDYPLNDKVAFDKYLITSGKDDYKEVVQAWFLDKNNKTIAHERLSRGDYTYVRISYSQILQRAVFHNSAKIILVHNHPGFYFAKPSSEDLTVMHQLAEILSDQNIELAYSVIYTDYDTNWTNLKELYGKTEVKPLLGALGNIDYPEHITPAAWDESADVKVKEIRTLENEHFGR